MLSALLEHGYDIRQIGKPEQPVQLHCTAIAAGYEQRLNERYAWDGMKRGTSPFLVLQHTLFGEGRLDFAGTQYRLRPGQTMLVTMPHAHRYFLERGGHWEYFWLLVSGREALRIAREIIDAYGPVLEPDAGSVDRLAASCHALLTRPMTAGEASGHAYQALACLHDTAFAGATHAPAIALDIGRVLAYIETNFASTLTVDRLSAVAGISRAHFVRRFSAEVGTPPSDYVMARRLERVERLLLATEMGIGEIAKATGFADGNYLAKVFRRHRAMSPIQYRATRAEAG